MLKIAILVHQGKWVIKQKIASDKTEDGKDLKY